MRSDPGPPRGIVRGPVLADDGALRHARIGPSPALAPYLRHLWIVAWDVRAPRQQTTLSHPASHFVFERGASRVVGVPRGRFVRELRGRGAVVGVALRAGMLPLFTGAPAWRHTGRMDPLETVFGDAVAHVERALFATEDDAARVALAERFLTERLPPIAPEAALAASIVEHVERNPALTRVEQVAARAGLDVRGLQRLFRRYVGVSPKWVLQRYRIHEALARVAAADAGELARLAVELGFADQAHFARCFKQLVGLTPGEYARGQPR